MGRRERAAGFYVERPGSGGAVTQGQGVVKVQLRTLGEVDRFPVEVAGAGAGGAATERQDILAQPTVQAGCGGEQAFIEVVQQRRVAAVAHQNSRVDEPAAPLQLVVARAGPDLADDFATADGNAVIAAADTDIAADASRGEDDGVLAKTGHQVADDISTGHVENIVIEFHVDPADSAAGHLRNVAVFERVHDGPAAHQECIKAITLCQGQDPAAIHGEIVGLRTLLDITVNHAVGIDHDAVDAGAERDIAANDAAAVGGHGQAVVTRKVRQPGTGAAVADISVIACGWCQRASGHGGRAG